MHIRIIVVGKPSREYRKLLDKYEKRLRGVDILEYKESVKDEQLLDACKGLLVFLDIEGTPVSSEELAMITQQHKDLTFIIGGAEGLPEKIRRRADMKISLGRITLPHQLARLVLTEQLYRAQTIREGKKYHK